jgi:GWxTD domain-containing protein
MFCSVTDKIHALIYFCPGFILNIGVYMKNIIFVLLLLIGNLFAQEYQEDFQKIKARYGFEIYRPAVVSFNYFIDYNGADWQPVLFLAVSVQNDFLQFTRKDNIFTTRYEVTLTVRNEEKTILSKTWQHTQELDDFDKTNSRKDFQVQNYKLSFDDDGKEIEPGEYEAIIEVHDKLSTREYKNKRKITVNKNEDSNPFLHSAIAFFYSRQKNEAQALRLSEMRNIVDFNKPYKAMATIFGPGYDTLGINVRLYKKSKSGKNLVSRAFIKPVKDTADVFSIGYELPYKTMNEGDYLLRFSSSSDKDSLEIEKNFSVLWLSKPLYLYKIDLAVRPMKYILTEEQIEEVKGLRLEDLDEWFNAFWKERDPSPNTVFNELLDTYYKRVTEAVRHYSNRFKEGWQTDQGMILLLYGEPTEIENRKYSTKSVPHIIWKYKKDDGEQVFTFVDKDKTGIFTLLEKEEGQN